MDSLVSIVVPAYNAEKFIDETISSVLTQTYSNWELILIDDGSTDNTSALIGKHSNNSKIKYFFQTNQGVSAARNNGIRKATGKYIAFLDADDYWLPNNLEEKVQFLETNPDYYWIFSDMYESDAFLNNLNPAPKGTDSCLLDNLLLWEGEVVPGPSSNLVIRKECIDAKVLFDVNISTAADLDFCIQLATHFKGKYLDKPLWIYRQLNQSMSRNVKVMEHDCLYIYNKALQKKLFKSASFKRKCFSNMYLILAGSWWVNGKNKTRGMLYVLKAIFAQPYSTLKKLTKKFFK